MSNQEKRILILDDDPFSVKALADRLRYEGLYAEVTDNPEYCLEAAQEKRFDLFILDLVLDSNVPEHLRDGIEVARALRADEATVNLPIVGITALMPERKEEALQLGMINFFEKPFDLDDIVQALQSILESRSKAQEAMASWLIQTAGAGWRVLELIVENNRARLLSSLVAGEGPLSLEGRDLEVALEMIERGQLDRRLFEEVGERLYRGLFPSQINVGLQQCRLLSQLAKQPVRLVLRILDPTSERLPWELCRYTGGTDGGHWLGGDPYLTCSRVANNSGPLQPDEVLRRPLRVLCVAPSPIGGPQLDLGGELRDIHGALRSDTQDSAVEWQFLGPAELIGAPPDLRPVAEASPANVNEALLRFRPQIVHFIAHSQEGALLLEEDGLIAEWLDFFLQLDLVGRGVRLLVLNSCLSGRPGSSSRGLALASLTAGVTAVVGHLYQVSDRAARRFASLLYKGLARGEAIDLAFQAARSRVWSEELQENRPFLPLLFIRDQFLRLDLGSAER